MALYCTAVPDGKVKNVFSSGGTPGGGSRV